MTAEYYSVEYRGDLPLFGEDGNGTVVVYLTSGLVAHQGEVLSLSEAKHGSAKLTLEWATLNPRKRARQRIDHQYLVRCKEVEGIRTLLRNAGGWLVEYQPEG